MTANKVDFYIQHFKNFESNKFSEVLKFQLFDIESSMFVQLLSSIEVLSLSPLWCEQPRNHQRSVITFQRKYEISCVSVSILNYHFSNLCKSKFQDSLDNEEQEKN